MKVPAVLLSVCAIALTGCGREQEVTVPDVQGESLIAISHLEAAHLVVAIDTAIEPECDEAALVSVSSQDPAAGKVVRRGETVRLVFDPGTGPVEICRPRANCDRGYTDRAPDLESLNLVESDRVIRNARIGVKTSRIPRLRRGDTYVVVAQSPAPGELVRCTQPVWLTLGTRAK
jgi:hypothetical protein